MIDAKIRMGALGIYALALTAFAQPQPSVNVLALNDDIGKPSFPVAVYRNLSVAEFRSMVRKSFEAVGFSFISADEKKNKSTTLKFNFNANLKTDFIPIVFVSTDELLDEKRRCNPCFLRLPELSNASEFRALPWMVQYDLNALLVPAIDEAYSTIETSGRRHMDPSLKFYYKRQWKGEQNLFGNSFIGIGLPELEERIVRSYRNAGFIQTDIDNGSNNLQPGLTFTFPVDSPEAGGAVYKVDIHSQQDADGNCYPCEIAENFDPHQQLPPAGLSGIMGRATLQSRFTVAREAAHEGIRVDLGRYLRPRSEFTVPAKPAALGSRRTPPLPPAAT